MIRQLLLVLGIAMSFPHVARAGGLRVENPPPEDKVTELVKGFPQKEHVERTDYYRDGKRVIAIVKQTVTVGSLPPSTYEVVVFYVDAETWVQVDVHKPENWIYNGSQKVVVKGSRDSILVMAPSLGYFENVFLQPERKVYDDQKREDLMRQMFAIKEGPL